MTVGVEMVQVAAETRAGITVKKARTEIKPRQKYQRPLKRLMFG